MVPLICLCCENSLFHYVFSASQVHQVPDEDYSVDRHDNGEEKGDIGRGANGAFCHVKRNVVHHSERRLKAVRGNLGVMSGQYSPIAMPAHALLILAGMMTRRILVENGILERKNQSKNTSRSTSHTYLAKERIVLYTNACAITKLTWQ